MAARTPSRLPAPSSAATTERKPLLYPQPFAPLLPNTSPAPFRRKRIYAETNLLPAAPPSEAPPPTFHKILIQEELDRLHTVVEAGQVLDLALAQDEGHVELEDADLHATSADPYSQTAAEFLLTGRKALPAALFEQLRTAQASDPAAKIASGLLPEIHRVWFGIDRKLFLWDYQEAAPLFQFSDLRDVVLTVAVVPKNRELFTHKVTHMLLISTPVELSIFGVVHEPFFNLIPTNLSVATNECRCLHFAWHPNGRIFAGGSEGKVLEITYEYRYFFSSNKRFKRSNCGPGLSTWLMSWFARVEVQALVCDPSRNLLYALLTCDTLYSPFQIDVYDLGPNGDGLKLVMSIDAWTFLQRLRESNSGLASVPPTRLDIQHIFPIKRSLSLDYHLLVVLKNGTRVLISLYVDIPQAGLFCKKTLIEDEAMAYRPTGEYSLTVKLPPISIDSHASPFPTQRLVTVGMTSDKPSDHDEMAFLEDASLLLLEHSAGGNRLIAVRRSLSRIAHLQTEADNQISEPSETISCVEEFNQVRVQSLAAVPVESELDPATAQLCGLQARNAFAVLPVVHWLNEDLLSLHCLPALATTLYLPPAQFQTLTEVHWLEFTELRPVDVLYNVLADGGNRERDRLVDMCGRFSVPHICAMLLSLALSPCSFARQTSASEAAMECVPPPIRHKAEQAFREVSTAKLESQSVPGVSAARELDVGDPLLALADHQALALYLGRILRPIWGETVAYTDPETHSIIEHFRCEHLTLVRERLSPFTVFIETHYSDSLQDLQRSNVLKLPDRVVRKDPVTAMYALANRSLQALELVEMLQEDFGFRRMAVELPPDDQTTLKQLTFKGLIATEAGHFLAKSLIEAYIKQLQVSRSARSKRLSVEQVLKQFSLRATGFFTAADAEIYMAQEALARAKAEIDAISRSEYLGAAIQRLMKNAASVSIRKVSDSLLNAHEVMPVVSLCIKKARDLAEIRGFAAIREMEECYETIFLILEDVHQSLSIHTAVPVPYLANRDLDNLARLESEILQECCKIPDKELHWSLLHWLVRSNLSHRIIQLDSPYVLEYITTELDLDGHPDLPLLAEYSMKIRDFKRAYLEYGRLATLRQDQNMTKDLLPLGRRSEYLDLSLVCLETYIKDYKGDELDARKLHDERLSLEISLRLCKIQLRIQRDLREKAAISTSRDLLIECENLDRMLLPVDELYEKVAKPRQLFEAQLELLHFHHETSPMQTPNTTALMKANFVPIIESLRGLQWPVKVAEKLEELGKKYPYSFPIDLVCKHCEAINLDLGVESPWVLQLLLSLPIGFEISQLYVIYEEMWAEFAGQGVQTAWLLFVRLERLMTWWGEIAERKTLPGAAYSETPHAAKCSLNQFSATLPAIFALLDRMETYVFPSTRQGLVRNSLSALREKFTQVAAKLQGKRVQGNPQQADVSERHRAGI